MNEIIGGGPTGRLFIHLREEKGYTYGASAARSRAAVPRRLVASDERAHGGHRAGAARSAGGNRADARRPVPDEELADAKRSMIASFALSLESPAQLLNYYVTSGDTSCRPTTGTRIPARIAAVTKAQVQAAGAELPGRRPPADRGGRRSRAGRRRRSRSSARSRRSTPKAGASLRLLSVEETRVGDGLQAVARPA